MKDVDLRIAERIVDLMNQALSADPDAVNILCGFRIPCNALLGEHPTIQTGYLDDDAKAGYEVGLLGILNGIAGAYADGPRKGWGAVAAHYEGSRIVRFGILPNEKAETPP